MSMSVLFFFAGCVSLALSFRVPERAKNDVAHAVSAADGDESRQLPVGAEVEAPSKEAHPAKCEVSKRELAAARLQAMARVRLGRRGGRHQKLKTTEVDDPDL